MNELANAITDCTTASSSLRKSQQGFDFSASHDPHHTAYERRNAAGTVSHIQARGTHIVRSAQQVTAPKVNLASITRFSSGMTSITELKAGTSVLADSGKVGLGIDIGLLTAPAMKALANGIVNHRARVFIDSGAFSLFRKNLKSHQTAQQLSLMGANEAPEWKTMDFEKVLAKYDAVMDAIEEANPAEEPITPPYFVMPDIIGDQEGTADLYRKHRDWISGQIQFNPNCIVPLQVGAKTLADAYREIVGIIGVDRFVVGIPSQEEAVSNQELIEFLREIKPPRVHFLGAVAEVTLAPRIEAVNASGHIPDISADGNILRSKLYGHDVAGNNRHEKVATVLKQELDLSEVYSRYLDQGSPTMHKDLSKAVALGAMAAELLKSHVTGYTKQDGTAVKEHEDSRQAHALTKEANKASRTARKTGTAEDHQTAASAHKKAAEAHQAAWNSHKGEDGNAKHFGALHTHLLEGKKHEDAAHEAGETAQQEAAEHKPGGEEPGGDKDDLKKAVSEVQTAADELLK